MGMHQVPLEAPFNSLERFVLWAKENWADAVSLIGFTAKEAGVTLSPEVLERFTLTQFKAGFLFLHTLSSPEEDLPIFPWGTNAEQECRHANLVQRELARRAAAEKESGGDE